MKKLRIVLSLFDGMSCGQIALNRAGVDYDKYYASEIEKHAIRVTQHNYPNTIQLGDINNWREWPIEWDKVDLIFAGSPCQGFSFAGKQLAFNDPRSKLFFVFVDILNHVKTVNSKVKFLLENVVMKQEFQEIITQQVGVEPVLINSALVSAQNRKRLYWANWHFEQPQDEGILLKDIVESSDAYKCARITGRKINPETGKRDDYNENIATEQRIEPRLDEKTGTLTTVQKDNVLILQKGRGNNPGGIRAINGKAPCVSANSWQDNNHLIMIGSFSPNCQKQINKNKKSLHEKSIALCTNSNLTGSGVTPIDVEDGIHVRKLTPVECERLQTVPDGYTAAASDSQRYRMLGNGWTIDVIAHILSTIESRVESIAKQGIFNFE